MGDHNDEDVTQEVWYPLLECVHNNVRDNDNDKRIEDNAQEEVWYPLPECVHNRKIGSAHGEARKREVYEQWRWTVTSTTAMTFLRNVFLVSLLCISCFSCISFE